jgi:hypothetical protein
MARLKPTFVCRRGDPVMVLALRRWLAVEWLGASAIGNAHGAEPDGESWSSLADRPTRPG